MWPFRMGLLLKKESGPPRSKNLYKRVRDDAIESRVGFACRLGSSFSSRYCLCMPMQTKDNTRPQDKVHKCHTTCRQEDACFLRGHRFSLGAMAANAFCVHHHFLIQGVDPANAFCVHHHFLIRRVVNPLD